MGLFAQRQVSCRGNESRATAYLSLRGPKFFSRFVGLSAAILAGTAPSAAVDGDIDGDGDVDLADLATLLAAYDTCDGDPGYNPDADLDDSGCIGLADLLCGKVALTMSFRGVQRRGICSRDRGSSSPEAGSLLAPLVGMTGSEALSTRHIYPH